MHIFINLIQGARWSFLLAGVLYGSVRYNFLSARERKRLDELEKTRPEREARQAEERKRKLEGLKLKNILIEIIYFLLL